MSPDNRRHRGAHPADRSLFSEEKLPVLRRAVAELSWLLTRDYKLPSSLKLIGDRYGLVDRQRLAVSRAACSDWAQTRRNDHCVLINELNDRSLIIDGFNLIITIEAALSAGVVLICRDGCIRDLSSVHGSYRSVDETERAISIIGESLEKLGVGSALWLLDRPISNSGRLAARINQMASAQNWDWEVNVVFNPDSEIAASSAVAVTSDSSILDEVESWTNLKSHLLTRYIPDAWIVNLSAD
jgi:hypothetical protein